MLIRILKVAVKRITRINIFGWHIYRLLLCLCSPLVIGFESSETGNLFLSCVACKERLLDATCVPQPKDPSASALRTDIEDAYNEYATAFFCP